MNFPTAVLNVAVVFDGGDCTCRMCQTSHVLLGLGTGNRSSLHPSHPPQPINTFIPIPVYYRINRSIIAQQIIAPTVTMLLLVLLILLPLLRPPKAVCHKTVRPGPI